MMISIILRGNKTDKSGCLNPILPKGFKFMILRVVFGTPEV